jgi:heterodisulfide reductase subunit C
VTVGKGTTFGAQALITAVTTISAESAEHAEKTWLCDLCGLCADRCAAITESL